MIFTGICVSYIKYLGVQQSACNAIKQFLARVLYFASDVHLFTSAQLMMDLLLIFCD